MHVHCEGPNITEAIPDRSADSKMNRLDLDRESQTVRGRHFRDVSTNRSESAADGPFASMCVGRRDPEPVSEVREHHNGERVGELNLRDLLLACRGDARGLDVLSGRRTVVSQHRSRHASESVAQSEPA